MFCHVLVCVLDRRPHMAVKPRDSTTKVRLNYTTDTETFIFCDYPYNCPCFPLNSTLKLTYRSEPVATTYRGNTDTPNLYRYRRPTYRGYNEHSVAAPLPPSAAPRSAFKGVQFRNPPRQIYKNVAIRTEMILNLVFAFQVDRDCFQGEEAPESKRWERWIIK